MLAIEMMSPKTYPMRQPNSYIVPTAVMLGINIERARSGIWLFYHHVDKCRSPLYFLNAIAMCMNIVSILVSITQIDYVNSPYQTSRGLVFLMTILASLSNGTVGCILLYVLFSRLFIFYKV
jgi:hypothetical protein